MAAASRTAAAASLRAARVARYMYIYIYIYVYLYLYLYIDRANDQYMDG